MKLQLPKKKRSPPEKASESWKANLGFGEP